MTDVPGEEEFTELVDAQVPRVDLVGRPANGTSGFLLMKQDATAGLLDPGFVRDLIGKSEPAPPAPDPVHEETVTMTGSPAAILKLIHQAAVAKAKYDADDLKRMARSGAAMPDESYPIADNDDLTRAVRAVGRGGADHDAIRRHVIARAKALGASSEIPDNWNADGSLKGDVAKEMDMADDALDPMTALAEPDTDAPGMDTDPGSPAWEAVDAATARKWTAILARAKNAIDLLAEREMLEAASADPDDAENAWDLQDACCAIDYAISVLAPFAVAEQAEADCGDDMQMVGKALAGFDAEPLDTIEALGHVRKAGRVLSTANEAAIRGAVESLQKVLASLPAAPTTEDSGRPVAKTANEEPDMPTPTPSAEATATAGQEPAMGTAEADPKPVAGEAVTDMAKADGEKTPMVVVYDQKGRLIGIVDPGDVTPVANAEADADDMDDTPAADTDAAPDASDLTPAPAAEAGTPADAAPGADDVNKTTESTDETDTTSDAVLKSSITDAVRAEIDAYSATREQVVAKQAADLAQMVKRVEELTELVKALEEQPAVPGVFTNGAVPPPEHLRGQDNGVAPLDTARVQALKKGLYSGATAADQNQAANELNEMAIARLREIQRH